MKAKILLLNSKEGNEEYSFQCPGCKKDHIIDVGIYDFNNKIESPTFRPSIRIAEKKDVCHMYVTEGKIQYLSDCTHELAGKEIEMENVKSGRSRRTKKPDDM